MTDDNTHRRYPRRLNSTAQNIDPFDLSNMPGGKLASQTGTASMATSQTVAASLAANPTNADLLAAIVRLQGSLESKITVVSNNLGSVQSTLSSVVDKVRDIEEAVSGHEARLAAQDAKIKALQAGYDDIRKTMLANELRSRRFNVRLGPVTEGHEKQDATGFVSRLIPSLLGSENFPDGVRVDIAHRVGPKPDRGGRTRSIIARIHYLDVKQLIVKLAAQKAPLSYNGMKVSIFPDLPTEVFQQRKKFYDVRGRCKTAGLQSGFVGTRQTRLRITRDGDTRYFDTPEAADAFLDAARDTEDGGGARDNDDLSGGGVAADDDLDVGVNGAVAVVNVGDGNVSVGDADDDDI